MQSVSATGRWGFIVRLAVTAACLVALAVSVDGPLLWTMMTRLPAAALLAAFALHFGIILLLAWRWRIIVHACGRSVTYDMAIRLTFTATFFNMILPLSVGGDIGRVWLARQAGIDLATGTTVAVLDRLSGVLALAILLGISSLALPTDHLPLELRLAMVLCLPAMLIGLWLLSSLSEFGARQRPWLGWLERVSAKMKSFVHHPAAMRFALLPSLAGHVMAVLVLFVIAKGLGMTLSLNDALLLGPVILLATMLPLSIGGWGLREAAAIVVLSAAGIASEQALAMALMFGVTQLAVSGAGSILYLGWTGLRFGGSRP